jgi:hypothetical protein
MLMEISGGGAAAAPPPPPPKPPPPPAPPEKQAPHGDTIAHGTQHSGPSLFGSLWHAAGSELGRATSSVEHWSEKNWGPVAGFAHGLASVPGLVGREWSEASKINAKIASKTEHLASDWDKTAASARASAISDIDSTAHGASVAAEHAVAMMRDANRVPLFIERNAGVVAQADRSIVRVASTAKAAVSDSIERGPQLLRAPLHWLAGKAEQSLSHQYDRVKSAAKQFAADSNRLSSESETSLHTLARGFKSVSEEQGANAERFIARSSRLIGTTLSEKASVIEKVPVLRDVPIVGAALTGAGIVADAHEHGWGDSIVANVAQTAVGTAVTSGVADTLAGTFASAGLADGGATALGAVAATGPVGWALAGGVAAGALAGYGVYRAIESKEGQHLIAGAEHGAEAAATGVAHFGEKSWHETKSIAHDIGHTFSSIF